MTPNMWFHQNTKQNLTTPEVTRTVCDRRTLGDKRTWWEAASDTASANVLANLVSSCWCDTSASVLVLPSDTSASAAGRSARNEEGGAVH